jgi:hypothetical protein
MYDFIMKNLANYEKKQEIYWVTHGIFSCRVSKYLKVCASIKN